MMLAVMTYQVWIFVAVIVALGLGYFLADPLITKGMDTIYLKQIERSGNRKEYYIETKDLLENGCESQSDL